MKGELLEISKNKAVLDFKLGVVGDRANSNPYFLSYKNSQKPATVLTVFVFNKLINFSENYTNSSLPSLKSTVIFEPDSNFPARISSAKASST